MKRRDWKEQRERQQQRASSGYTSVRITKATKALLAQLKEKYVALTGLDELLYELASEELEEGGRRT